MFAHLFGIRPWEWQLLTHVEIEHLIASADAWVKARTKGS